MSMRKTMLLANRCSRWLPVLICLFTAATRAEETPLDRYVHAADPAYAWKVARTIPGDEVTTFVLELTSQTWRTSADVDQPVWKHWLIVAKPKAVQDPNEIHHKKAFLYIGGGANSDPIPESAPPHIAAMALATGTIVAELRMVPNQPLTFTDSLDAHRFEDDLIAYSRVRYFGTKDPTWLVRLAMVKSGVRAMDAITEFAASKDGGQVAIDGFVVAGGSKRGWTTWLVAAVDPRVVAIVPIVIDALNSMKVTRHHYEAYGFFSPALNDYVKHGLFPHKVGTPEYEEILAIEDPFGYRSRDRLAIPKYLVNASGDEYFLPDNWRYYYNELRPEKHIRYVPNAKHDLAGSDARESILAFYQMILSGQKRPSYSWQQEPDASVRVVAADKPKEVNLWQATNPKARDFRLDVIGPAWNSTPLKPESEGIYVARVPKPESGFTAFFVELVYDIGDGPDWKVTTGTMVVPDLFLFRWEDSLK